MSTNPKIIAQIAEAIRVQKEYKHDATPAVIVNVNGMYGFFFDSKPKVGDIIKNSKDSEQALVVARVTFKEPSIAV